MLNTTFEPFPTIHTNRLILRYANGNDADAMFSLRKNEAAMQYIPRPRPTDIAEIHSYLEILDTNLAEGKAINWAICSKEQPNNVIGMIGYVTFCHDRKCAEIGYMLHPNYWGKGYVPEAIKVVEDYGFNTIGLLAIEAKIDPRNENSKKVLIRNNYQFDKIVQKDFVFQNEVLDTEYYIKYK